MSRLLPGTRFAGPSSEKRDGQYLPSWLARAPSVAGQQTPLSMLIRNGSVATTWTGMLELARLR